MVKMFSEAVTLTSPRHIILCSLHTAFIWLFVFLIDY